MTTITFKVTEEEAWRIRAQASKDGISISEYLRRRAGVVEPGPEEPRRVRCRHTGAMIFSSMGGQSPVTTESVRELLSDFP